MIPALRVFPEMPVLCDDPLIRAVFAPDPVAYGFPPTDGLPAGHTWETFCAEQAKLVAAMPPGVRHIRFHGLALDVTNRKQQVEEEGKWPSDIVDRATAQCAEIAKWLRFEGVTSGLVVYLDLMAETGIPGPTLYRAAMRKILKGSGLWGMCAAVIDPDACRIGRWTTREFNGFANDIRTDIDKAGTSLPWPEGYGHMVEQLFPGDPERQSFASLINNVNSVASRLWKGPVHIGLVLGDQGGEWGYPAALHERRMDQYIGACCAMTSSPWHCYQGRDGAERARVELVAAESFARYMHLRPERDVLLDAPIPLDATEFVINGLRTTIDGRVT